MAMGIWNSREHYQFEPDEEEDDDDEEDVDGTSITLVASPSDAWAETLNTLVRLLILRIPRGSLQNFIWSHNCEVKQATLEVLSKYHGGSLLTLYLGPFNDRFTDAQNQTFDRLEVLSAPAMTCDDGQEGVYLHSVLADGSSTLYELDLGIEWQLAKDYIADEDSASTERLSTYIMGAFNEHPQQSECLPNVHHLKLRGLDLSCMMNYKGRNIVNVEHLTKLSLESCCRLGRTLAVLEATQLPRLESLHIRHELVNTGICSSLERVLCSLPPLKSLVLLLEGNIRSFGLENVLEVHGDSLRALIMDFRGDTRPSIHESRTLWEAQYLKIIAEFCPNLIELGIPVKWQPWVARSSQRLAMVEVLQGSFPKLRTLNIREMPMVNSSPSCMSVDAMLKGLALWFMENLLAARKSTKHALGEASYGSVVPSIEVLAFGALVFKAVWDETITGLISFRDEYLTLRTFSVEYLKKSDSTYTPVLTQIAKGSTVDLSETYDDISILKPYWLA